jgi:hypothetical protein
MLPPYPGNVKAIILERFSVLVNDLQRPAQWTPPPPVPRSEGEGVIRGPKGDCAKR